jgi:hypothetical protein
MNVFSSIRSFGSRALQTPLAGLMFFLPALLAAQTVTYQTNGLVSITGGPPIYNGRFVLKESDFGFFWLDTMSLERGHVQAESKCGGFQPPSDSGLYVIGDCNGITNISSSGNVVLVRQFSGQCGATTLGCNGPRNDGHSRFTFALGTWDYLGDGVEISDSAQTTDLQGRTWTLAPADSGGRNFIWQSSGLPNSPPIAVASATNVSAGSRGDKTNYYGDKWQLQDTSGGNPTSVTWDFNYTGSFVADETGTEAAEGLVIGYFPCDPGGGTPGNIRSGSNCRQSLGLTNPPATGNYQFALRSANQFGTSTNTFVSAAIGVACPRAGISGYTGFTGTCVKTGGSLSVPTGGNADASFSSGNIGEATFSWTFTFPSGPPAGLQGASVAVPNGANGFALSIDYPGGYQATASGAVQFQPAIVPDFSSPGSVIRGSTFSLTNHMQKASTTTLDSVDYLFNPGACGTPPAMPSNPLAATFLTAGGSAAVTAPTAGSYCIFLRFNYTVQGSPPTSQIVSHPLTVTEWVSNPSIGIYLDSGKTQPAQFIGGSYYLTTRTNYYLFDEEPPPPAGVAYPGAQWSLGSAALGSTPTQTFLPVNFGAACSGCALKLTVGAVTRQIVVNIACSANSTTLCLNARRIHHPAVHGFYGDFDVVRAEEPEVAGSGMSDRGPARGSMAEAACIANATTLCLSNNRFKVQVQWTAGDGSTGPGRAVALAGDTGHFWFFSPNNVEIVVKVVDGRVVNSRFWVFAGGLTNVNVVMTVTDAQTGAAKSYTNPQATAFQPIQDTGTFLASNAPEAEFESRVQAPMSRGDGTKDEAAPSQSRPERETSDPGPPLASTAEAACTANTTTLCLNNSRFKVQVQWTTGDGSTGSGQAVSLTSDTGYFWFFSPNNVEMVLKAVDGCAFNSSFWVFAGGLTNVNVVATVTDMQTGVVRTYVNPQGVPFQPLQDTSAFACP